jgi:hypothetical protein
MSMTAGLQAAVLLAQGRPEGLDHVGAGRESAARSFWAAAICLPAFLCLRLIELGTEGVPRHLGHDMALDLIFYVLGWAGYAVLSRPLAAAMGRQERWPLFIAAWNWCNIVQYVLFVLASIPALLGAPAWVGETAGLVALGWALWLEWFAARVSLQIDGFQAIAPVFLDVSIGVVLAILTEVLI